MNRLIYKIQHWNFLLWMIGERILGTCSLIPKASSGAKSYEKGFTLIELVVGIAIAGAIMGVMSMSVIMMMKVSQQNSDQALALQQVQDAGYWVSRDIVQAQVIDEAPASPELLVLQWVEINDAGISENCTVTYQLDDMADGTKKLTRKLEVDGALQAQILVAEYLYYEPVSDPDTSTIVLDYPSPLLKFRITAMLGTATVSRQYEATQRVPADL